jgi:long-chain acyl-CoA synthetase
MFTSDADGFLYFVSRSDTIIKSHGERVGGSEVEAVLNDCPGVAEAAVIGVPGGVAGDAIVVFVASEGASLTERQLDAHCAERLTTAARPTHFFMSSELLPRTPNGKIDRRLLRETAAHAISA